MDASTSTPYHQFQPPERRSLVLTRQLFAVVAAVVVLFISCVEVSKRDFTAAAWRPHVPQPLAANSYSYSAPVAVDAVDEASSEAALKDDVKKAEAELQAANAKEQKTEAALKGEKSEAAMEGKELEWDEAEREGDVVDDVLQGPMLEPVVVFKLFAPSLATLKEQAEQSAQWWFGIFTPARWIIGHTPLSRLPVVGKYCFRFSNMTAPPEVLPSITADGVELSAHRELMADRTSFWSAVLMAKWALMPISAEFWRYLLITRQQPLDKDELIPATQWSRQSLKHIFVVYHVSHNAFLYYVVDIGVCYCLLSDATGLDWELWNLWFNWILLVVNATAIVKYYTNLGNDVRSSVGGIVMLFCPVIGNDIHLAKDWMFIGLTFMTHFRESGWRAIAAIIIGVLSMICVFLPLGTLLPDESHLISFVASHWPIVLEGPKFVPGRDGADDTVGTKLRRFITSEAIPQTTIAKEVVARTNELPQAALELVYMLIYGFKPAVAIALLISLAKAIAIPTARKLLEQFIISEENVDLTRSFAKANNEIKEWMITKPVGCKVADCIPLLVVRGVEYNGNNLESLEPLPLNPELNIPPCLGQIVSKMDKGNRKVALMLLRQVGCTAGLLSKSGIDSIDVRMMREIGYELWDLAFAFNKDFLRIGGINKGVLNRLEIPVPAWRLKEADFTEKELTQAGYKEFEFEASFRPAIDSIDSINICEAGAAHAGALKTAMLTHDGSEARHFAAKLLAVSASAESLGDLAKAGYPLGMADAAKREIAETAKLLSDDDGSKRKRAAQALGRMLEQGAQYAAEQAELLSNGDDPTRRRAAENLGYMGELGQFHADEQVKLLSDPNSKARAADNLRLMGKVGAKKAEDEASLLTDTDAKIRADAAERLGAMGVTGAPFSADVEKLLRDNDSQVRLVAATALCKMDKVDDCGNEYLRIAIDTKDAAVLQVFLSHDADTSGALALALESKEESVIEALMTHKVAATEADLKAAANTKNAKATSYALQHGCPVSVEHLAIAVRKGATDVVKLLLDGDITAFAEKPGELTAALQACFPSSEPTYIEGAGNGDNMYCGIAVGVDGLLYCAPWNAPTVLVIDPKTRTLRQIKGAGYGHAKYSGIAAALDGKLYCSPCHAKSVLVIDPATSTVSFIEGTNPMEFKYWGIEADAKGLVYCAPHKADHVLIIDPVNQTLSHIDAGIDGDSKYRGITKGDDGLLYCAPCNASSVLVIDPQTKSCSLIEGAGEEDGKYDGITKGPDGSLYCAPSSTDSVLVIDPRSRTLSRIPGAGKRGDKYCGVATGSDGRLYFAPKAANTIMKLEIDPSGTGKLSFIKGAGDSGEKCFGIAATADDTMFCAPFATGGVLTVGSHDPIFLTAASAALGAELGKRLNELVFADVPQGRASTPTSRNCLNPFKGR